MHATPVAVSASNPVGEGEDQVLPQVADSSIKRRLLSVKGTTSSLHPPPIKARRLSVKGPAPFLLPPLPSSMAAVLPSERLLWNDVDETTFVSTTHRRRYRLVYNKYHSLLRYCRSVWVKSDEFCSMDELSTLGSKKSFNLKRRQKIFFMRHFLQSTGAPPWVMQFAVQQWPCHANEQKPKLILNTQTALLTFRGAWGVLELGANLLLNPTTDQLTEHVREMQEAQNPLESILSLCRTTCGGVACSLMGMLLGDMSQDLRGGEAAALTHPLISQERGTTASLRECEQAEVPVLGTSSEGNVVG